ncbi:MAG: metal-sensitive transcriptional regulator [Anaerolineales bacterium]
MDDTARQQALNRLKSAAGHLQGTIKMLEDDRYCIDVIKQVQAVQAALEKTNQMILDSHLRTCVTTAIQHDDATERERVLNEVMDVFRASQ